jgi:uncharacterized protein
MSDQELNLDSYANLVTGLGTSKDKTLYSTFIPDRRLGPTELATQYEGDALTARVVDRLVDDATRTDWRIKGADESFDWASIKSRMDDLGALMHGGDAWRWSRLYGGGLVIMAVNDGRKYSEPLDTANIRDFTGLTVVDSSVATPVGFVAGLGSQAFSQPTQYQINVPLGKGDQRVVHASRCIRFDGMRVPASRMINNGGWAPSLIQRCHKSLRGLNMAMQYAETLLQEISVMVLKIPGLTDKLCGGPDNVRQVKQMLETLRWGVDTIHLMGLDKEMDFMEVKRSVDGVAALIDKFEQQAVRDTGIPRIILTGEQPAGLGADSKGEVRAWYDYVESQRKLVLTPALNRILEVEFARRARKGEAVPTEWEIEYEPLMSPSSVELSQTASTWATAMGTLVDKGILSPTEARAHLVSQGVLDVSPEPLAVPEVSNPSEPEIVGDEPEDEVSLVWSTEAPPADAMEAKTLAAELGIPTVRITRAHRAGLIRGWTILGGKPRYSRHEVQSLILAQNGALPDPELA